MLLGDLADPSRIARIFETPPCGGQAAELNIACHTAFLLEQAIEVRARHADDAANTIGGQRRVLQMLFDILTDALTQDTMDGRLCPSVGIGVVGNGRQDHVSGDTGQIACLGLRRNR